MGEETQLVRIPAAGYSVHFACSRVGQINGHGGVSMIRFTARKGTRVRIF